MERDDKSRFRITTWPGERLPHPGPGVRFAHRLHPAGLIVISTDDRPQKTSPRWSEERYLELAAIDLDDEEEILSWVNVFGMLGVRYCMSAWRTGDLGGLWYFGNSGNVEKQLNEDRAAILTTLGDERVGTGETLAEFRWGATCIRDLISAWRVVNGELDPKTHRWESPIWETIKEDPTETPPWEQGGSEWLLETGMAYGLETFSPFIRLDGHKAEFESLWGYDVCILELFNHIVEQATYRVCANETCGRLFVRQRGRSAHGQHRTKGVKYCSTECARAQAQREYRRRKKAAKPHK